MEGYPTIRTFINENHKPRSYTYKDNAVKSDIDAIIKRKEVKRRSADNRHYYIALLGNNTVYNFGKDDGFFNRYNIDQVKKDSHFAVSIGLCEIEASNLSFRLQYILYNDRTLCEHYYIIEDDIMKTQRFNNVYEFSADGENVATIDYDRQAHRGEKGNVYRAISDSVLEVSSGGWSDKKENVDWEGYGFEVYLKLDGKVLLTGNGNKGRRNVTSWKNIIAVSACDTYILGLTRDGHVLSAGENTNGRCNTSNWTDIVDIAATDERSFGLKSDGSLVCTDTVNGLKDLTNIVGIARYICVKNDGTIVKIYNNGLKYYNNLKLWCNKKQQLELLRSDERELIKCKEEKTALTKKYDAANGILFRRKKEELGDMLAQVENRIRFYESKGPYLTL